jgi:predicted nuclease with TOPRIM domain
LEELEKENELLKTGLRKKDGETSELRARLDQKDGETQGLKKRLDNLEAALYAVVNPEKKA